MKSKYKIIFLALLVLAICFAGYLIAQILIPEPIPEKLTDLTNPSHKAAQTLIEAYLDNQPDKVRDLLSRTHLDHIYHSAALSETAIKPEQAMAAHTTALHQYCQERIKHKMFFPASTEIIGQERIKYEICAGFEENPGKPVLYVIMQKENDGFWRCEEIVKIP